MRSLTLFGSTLLIALVMAASPARAADWDLDTFKRHSATSDWEGYGVGTTFTEKSESKSAMGGMTTETRKTLVKVEADKFTIKVETKNSMSGDEWKSHETTVKRKKDVKFETKDAGEESLKIGETDYACKKVVGTKIEDGKSENMTFWIHATHGVVQLEGQEAGGPKIKITASRFSVEKKIGDASFKCREFTGSVMGGKLTMVIALNSPERTLSMSMEMHQGGMAMTNKKEVTAVKLVKAAVTTGAK